MTNSEGRGRYIPVIMAMWLVPMAAETMFSELISSEPERVKTEHYQEHSELVGLAESYLCVRVCVCV